METLFEDAAFNDIAGGLTVSKHFQGNEVLLEMVEYAERSSWSARNERERLYWQGVHDAYQKLSGISLSATFTLPVEFSGELSTDHNLSNLAKRALRELQRIGVDIIGSSLIDILLEILKVFNNIPDRAVKHTDESGFRDQRWAGQNIAKNLGLNADDPNIAKKLYRLLSAWEASKVLTVEHGDYEYYVIPVPFNHLKESIFSLKIGTKS